ncbi:hypothetical protein AB0J81_29985 [Streptomyces bobili]|uniref:hypothetical protein n=1 Tax=Streptomyces bobili TaxID=67280 RepID=UPI0034361979
MNLPLGNNANVHTAREVFGTSANAEEAIAYNRSRVATATAVALYRSGYRLPMPDDHLDDAAHALDFPYSEPSPETRAAIRAALAVLDSDYTITVTRWPIPRGRYGGVDAALTRGPKRQEAARDSPRPMATGAPALGAP